MDSPYRRYQGCAGSLLPAAIAYSTGRRPSLSGLQTVPSLPILGSSAEASLGLVTPTRALGLLGADPERQPGHAPDGTRLVTRVPVGRRDGDAYLRIARRNIPSAIRTRSRKTSSAGPRLKGI